MDYHENEALGINIDIFPIDGTPKNNFRRKIFFTCQLILFRFYIASVSIYKKDNNMVKSIIKKILYNISKKIGKKHFIKIINKNALRYDFDSSDIVAMSVAPYRGKINPIDRNIFERFDIIFENKQFSAPKGYDIFLKTEYGDYMDLPPIEQQTTHHKYKAYWR